MVIGYYIIGCCLLLWAGISIWAIRYSIRQWPALFYTPIEARILNTELFEEAAISSSDGPDSRVNKVLRFDYCFTVNGDEYRGHDVGGQFQRKGGELLYRGKKMAGDTVTVYYNPDNPSQNTHKRFAFFGGIILLGLGQLFLWLAIDLMNP
ncbi:MAG: DUF3592 domain-containing protein [Xanthomonadales bacterium]|nr:DUF3592 domain-containing protein [Xanthomonadales bacterium]